MSQLLGCVVPASRALVLDQEHELEARERILTSLVRAGYLATDGRAFVVAGRGCADFNL